MKAIRLKINHMFNPIGIDNGPMFFSWQCEEDLFQTAVQIKIFIKGELHWDSGKVISNETSYNFKETLPFKTYFEWKIRLWNEKDEVGNWSEISFFETGLDTKKLDIQWINPELERLTNSNYSSKDLINSFAKKNWEEKKYNNKIIKIPILCYQLSPF